MNTQHKTGTCEEEMSPHVRQRVAFLAALIPAPQSANWAAISDTWEDLSRETTGSPYEAQVQLLGDPIRRQDVHALAQIITALLAD